MQSGTFVWDLPPGAADTALEELRKARIKRQSSLHIVLIPKLFTHLWKKQFLKCCDFSIEIPAGQNFWSHDQFEPLTLGICFPLLPSRPWQFRHTPKLFSMERTLSKVVKSYSLDGGRLLREFLLATRSWHTLPESMVWSLLFFQPRRNFPSYEYNHSAEKEPKRERSSPIGKGVEVSTSKKRRLHSR